MSRFQRWFLRRVFAQQVVQGPRHAANISELYALIREACEHEFFEDNWPTMNAFLLERFEVTQKGISAISAPPPPATGSTT